MAAPLSRGAYGGTDNSVTFGYTWYDNTLVYDVENRLIQAVNASPSCTSTSPCTYAYDPLGQRKEKTVNGTVATAFVLAAGSEIADYYASSATWRLTVRGAGGLPVAEIVPGATEQVVYVHHDVQGSTIALTTAGSSGPSDTYTYSDYGQPQSGSWSVYQYGGYRYDAETGLYYVNARYYSPVLGRFLQSDPAGFKGGFNLYAYTGNDPINLIDPTGMTSDGSSPFSNISLDQQSQLQQQFYLNDFASQLCLTPVTDQWTSTAREINYHLVYASDITQEYNGGEVIGPNGATGSGPALYVNELQTYQFRGTVLLQSGPNTGYYSSASPGTSPPNQFTDTLGGAYAGGQSASAGVITSTQSFTVSGAPGLYPAISAPVNVCYPVNNQVQTYGSLGIYLTEGTVFVNGYQQLPLTDTH